MPTLDDEFASAVRNVSIGDKRDRAIEAHKEVRSLLESDTELKEWGIDSVLIGSYARQTARYPGKDVDIFLRFTDLNVRYNPEKIYNAVQRVLVAKYGVKNQDPGGRVTLQSRSVKIDFPEPDGHPSDDAFAIDAVPAVPWGEHWGIPNHNRDQWDSDTRRWIKTNPVQFAADTNTLATAAWSPTVNGVNAYRPIVRLLRQVRHVHIHGRPGGLYFEIAAYYAWKDQLVTGTTWAELLASTLEHVGTRLIDSADEGLIDPVLDTPLEPALDSWQWRAAGQTVESLAGKATEGLAAEKCRAAKIWRDILGTNERGQVLPLPEGCDAGGFPVSSVSAVNALGTDKPRGFALYLPR